MGSWAIPSVLATRRLAHPIGELGAAAGQLAAGDYKAAVSPPGLGPELDALASAFNAMAAALQATETTRRRLLADAAHELRTPLATIDAYLEGLADGIRPSAPETWELLSSQTARLRRLADDIALASRAEEGQLPLHLVPVDVSEVASAAVQAARPGYDARGLRITAQLAAGLPDLMADPKRLGQVLAGLLDNALRHTPAGGQVTVSPATASPPSTCPTSSSGSTAPTPPVTAREEAPGSG